jgi:heme/copper-type cytochrome/quinol oxidase subunit 4
MNIITLLQTSRIVYILLIILSVVSYYLLHGVWTLSHVPKNFVEISIVLIAFVKVSLVSEYFMELHYSPKWLRAIMFGWIFTVSFTLIYFISIGL